MGQFYIRMVCNAQSAQTHYIQIQQQIQVQWVTTLYSMGRRQIRWDSSTIALIILIRFNGAEKFIKKSDLSGTMGKRNTVDYHINIKI